MSLLPESEETAALLQAREAFLAGRQRRMEEFMASAGGVVPVQAELCGLRSHEQLPAGRLDPLRDAGASEKGFRGRNLAAGALPIGNGARRGQPGEGLSIEKDALREDAHGITGGPGPEDC